MMGRLSHLSDSVTDMAVRKLLRCAELTDEQKEMQQVVRKFTRDEIIPKAAYHDQTGEVTKLIIQSV